MTGTWGCSDACSPLAMSFKGLREGRSGDICVSGWGMVCDDMMWYLMLVFDAMGSWHRWLSTV